MTVATGRLRTILHVDMDAFFVSVELLDRPELRGRPVVVGGNGNRGVVAAASYEARAYGVHSAMPSVTARRLCPDAVFLPGRHGRYAEVSARIMATFAEVTPLVEPISLDEAFLDVSGAMRLHGPAPAIADQLRRRVADREGLTCSVGIAPNKFLAKLASEQAKPKASPSGPVPGRGVYVVDPSAVDRFLAPLPVAAVWGVGPATRAKLERLGIATVGDLGAVPVDALRAAVGDAVGRHLHDLAHGIDERPVEPDLAPKSVSHEETFEVDLHHPDEVADHLVRMADSVAGRLRYLGLAGRTVNVKVRYTTDFRTITRARTLSDPTDDAGEILREARLLVSEVDLSPGIRLVGVGVTNLADGAVRQLSFDVGDADESAPADRDRANRAVDEVRERFGDRAIGPARLVGAEGLRRFEVGQQQWGPTGPGPTRPGPERPGSTRGERDRLPSPSPGDDQQG